MRDLEARAGDEGGHGTILVETLRVQPGTEPVVQRPGLRMAEGVFVAGVDGPVPGQPRRSSQRHVLSRSLKLCLLSRIPAAAYGAMMRSVGKYVR